VGPLKMKRLLLLLAGAATLLAIIRVPAQNRTATDSQTCPTPIYSAKEVSRRAKIIDPANLNALYEAFGGDAHGRVIVDAVLCRSGRVTDVKVIDSSPPTMGEFVAAAVRLIRFAPAELNWHSLSQTQRLAFEINDGQFDEIAPADAEGRIIEAVQIIGNRRFTAQEILSSVLTKPGDKCSFDRVMDDVFEIRGLGFFDKTKTRAWIEKGMRDGVVVNFEVVELPWITEVLFTNLKAVDEALLVAALENQHVNLRKGQPYAPEDGKAAIRIIKQVLASNGQPNTDVQLLIEMMTADEARLSFVIR
jgi:TonB family protein